MLHSDLCDYRDTYVVVKGAISARDPCNAAYNRKLAVKNNAPFISCISKINIALIDNIEDLDIALSMYNLCIVIPVIFGERYIYH